MSAATPETPRTEASPQTLDDRRYRASIHALEAEVDTLLSRAAGRGGAKARRDRDGELVRRSDALEALQLENAELRNDLQAAGREVERLRAACASAQSDTERPRARRLAPRSALRRTTRCGRRRGAARRGRGRGEDAALGGVAAAVGTARPGRFNARGAPRGRTGATHGHGFEERIAKSGPGFD